MPGAGKRGAAKKRAKKSPAPAGRKKKSATKTTRARTAREATSQKRRDRADTVLLAFLAGVGRQVAYLREHAELTQAEAAERAGLDARHWGRLEAGSTNPTVQTLLSVAKALEVEPNVLLVPRREANPRRRGRPPKKNRLD